MRLIFGAVVAVALAWWIWSRFANANRSGPHSGDAEQSPRGPANAPDAPMEEPPPAPELSPEPAPAAASKAAEEPVTASRPNIAEAVGEPDDLTRIKGIGPKLSELCHSLGVKRFDQIAAWTEDDVAEVDKQLKVKGRITRDRWVEQAKLLAAGDKAGYQAEFG